MVWDSTGIIPWYGIIVGYPMVPVADKISMEHRARRMEHGKHGAWPMEHGKHGAWEYGKHGAWPMEHGKHGA